MKLFFFIPAKHILSLCLCLCLCMLSCRKELPQPLHLTTTEATQISFYSAICGGTIENFTNNDITEMGICYATKSNPNYEDFVIKSTNISKSFILNITGLNTNTNYYARAYAINKAGINYGDVVQFTTAQIHLPEIITLPAYDITYTAAKSGGTITNMGDTAIFEKGICYSTIPNPTINDALITSTSDSLSFLSQITGLQPNTNYYIRAYAINNVGVAYGNEISFSTVPQTYATLTTADISNITVASAVSGGDITYDGGSQISIRGVCWSTSPNPTTYDNKTTNGSGSGSFTSDIAGLQVATTYYVRAYATNSVGTAYGNLISFTTDAVLPTITTTAITNISATTASSGGNITHNGGATIIERGVCWSKNPNPTTADNKTTDGIGTGSFTSYITGLQHTTNYYVRAYATNNIGTSYGNQTNLSTEGPCYGVSPPIGYGITESSGKCWLDRNLGASQIATSSNDTNAYGHLYQWGRGTDGHQNRTSVTTSTLSSNNQPGHSSFIIAPNTPFDWLNQQNTNLWQDINSTNNPCPSGWRVPTHSEWNLERSSWSTNNAAGAFNSVLKLPVAGSRNFNNGSPVSVDFHGYYWASTVSNINSRYLFFSINAAGLSINYRASALSVRCIKD